MMDSGTVAQSSQKQFSCLLLIVDCSTGKHLNYSPLTVACLWVRCSGLWFVTSATYLHCAILDSESTICSSWTVYLRRRESLGYTHDFQSDTYGNDHGDNRYIFLSFVCFAVNYNHRADGQKINNLHCRYITGQSLLIAPSRNLNETASFVSLDNRGVVSRVR